MGRNIEQMNNRNSNTNSSMSISKSSSKTSSSPSPFSSSAPSSSRTSNYSMEEVWKDICLSTLHHSSNACTIATPSTAAALQGIFFQEFLSRPPNTHRERSSSRAHDRRHSSFGVTDNGFFRSQGQPAATILSLNFSRPEFGSSENSDTQGFGKPPTLSFALPQDDLNAMESSAVEFSLLRKRRVPQNEVSAHRNKRMIKNRESAARSRARKQAYTNALENKVARLLEENAKLRRQEEKLSLAAPAQLPKKHMLHRTLAAPF